MIRLRLVAIVGLLVAASGCRAASGDASTREEAEKAILAAREQRIQEALAHPAEGIPSTAAIARWVLPSSLKEISGLALTPDGRLLAHGDEDGRIVELDYRRGAIVKRFMLGPELPHADFEGITVADSMVFLLASNGVLYEFKEGRDGDRVPYETHDTGLGQECEFEGVAFDPSIASLLLACKIVKTPALRDSLVIYRWKISADLAPAERISRLTVPLSRVIGTNPWKTVHPSDLTVDPENGDYVLIASKDKALIRLTAAGSVVSTATLTGHHPQAEGLAITKDGILIISDEAAKDAAVLTVYRQP